MINEQKDFIPIRQNVLKLSKFNSRLIVILKPIDYRTLFYKILHSSCSENTVKENLNYFMQDFMSFYIENDME